MTHNVVTEIIKARRIDSFQKLRFLLYLQNHPDLAGTVYDFASQLYLGDMLLIERIIADLQKTQLLERVDNLYKLPDKPDIRAWLQELASAFEDPLERQALLDQVTLQAAFPI